ncbi:unnamed protein product [Anisakis simplex]|uniref:Mannosyl-oligosaccharide glucosidase n=1 Tax=Anisakis simplex TaxID=6269 RepID=A0A0M3IY93_ANISI|nr:unnamed protein product [Anisakis simplex]
MKTRTMITSSGGAAYCCLEHKNMKRPPKTAHHHPAKGNIANGDRRTKKESFMWKIYYVTILVVIVSIGAQYYYHNYIYLPGLISQKSELPVLDLGLDRKQWGTYRSHLYFGLRTPHPDSPLFGMIWYEQPGMNVMVPPVRHWCAQNEGIKSFGWNLADGRSFGCQTIRDTSFDLKTDWVNKQHSWTARVSTESTLDTKVALIFYLLVQEEESYLHSLNNGAELLDSFSGFSRLLGNFTVKFVAKASPNHERSFLADRSSEHLDITKIKETIISVTEVDRNYQTLRLPNRYMSNEDIDGDERMKFIAVQINLPMNSSVEISFANDETEPPRSEQFDTILKERTEAFTEKFERIFGLAAKSYSGFYQYMGRYALSNMLGSIGYTSGFNRVQSIFSTKQSKYGKHELFTSCPSRSTFPRGFLWDEGFHHLLIRKFDPELSLQIISSWLNTMNAQGWIPREMILSGEDEMLVPNEFLIQRDSIANPPMFFYLIQRFLDDEEFMRSHRDGLVRLYARLRLWHAWLNSTQVGPQAGTYRWHGRNASTDLELNPKTLPSGLDDYPRATHPTDQEYHLDIRSWMAVAAKTLSQLAILAEDELGAETYRADADYLQDIQLLNKLHWSETSKRYCDYGLHSSHVELRRQMDMKEFQSKSQNRNNPNMPPPPMKRIVHDTPKLGLVENTFGYLSLYPVMLKLLPHDSDNLRIILENLRSEKDLWSKYGLRSISKQSPYYQAHNTEHDPPYWRGAVWINMNYMMLSALKYYASLAGPNQEVAFHIYSQLRNNVVANMVREFKRTGYLWENYADDDGQGRGAHPFTGWSSLVLSIMAEQYD